MNLLFFRQIVFFRILEKLKNFTTKFLLNINFGKKVLVNYTITTVGDLEDGVWCFPLKNVKIQIEARVIVFKFNVERSSISLYTKKLCLVSITIISPKISVQSLVRAKSQRSAS